MTTAMRSFGDRMLGALLGKEVAAAVYCPHSGPTCATSCYSHGVTGCEYICETDCYAAAVLCWTHSACSN
ncbi:hypothetical protein [Actinospica robiniae]|uniref:Uncharacterized protein n=1 Tax=Actinospica robiniae DSM 44927 TaxID=479430 RepID=W9DZR0_9ACTN|nr:hypothetical protein [Actinospica robiniae]ETA71080.1 hypothetical protein ActroDRAFT_0102 [Actinospica robiniae DSM 44927]